MRPPLIHKSLSQSPRERGVTMVLVAVAMVAIIAMAALSIDIIVLYLDREEAQRSADTAALAAARVLSLSGVTGDPNNTQGGLSSPPWPAACALATQLAQAIANQNSVGSAVPNSVSVTFRYNGAVTDCSNVSAGFGINPQVQVQISRQGLPTMFSRIWTRNTNTVSATAIAEAFNPSNSGTIAASGSVVPVNPHCVKPWIIANSDPVNPGTFVDSTTGSITKQGIRLSGVAPGVIGENFLLSDACSGSDCSGMWNKSVPVGSYVPALVTSAASAVPTCSTASDPYQEAIGGCDQSTTYACGTVGGGAQADLTINPGGAGGDTFTGAQCLIHQAAGQDVLDTSVFPYQIGAGAGNPVVTSGIITSSSSIVTLPIYDNAVLPNNVSQPQINIVGFLQVFITNVNSDGSLEMTVLNVAGCGNAASSLAVSGTSPVPIRLITPSP
jgi:Flp pilus assembly protein TadG